ncbi:acetyl-CoA synthetase-like protein [Hymenopellis radicata]|nr:acetyl-CoA synthetase-like protein [Hymenopellis radicata]
MAPEKLDSQRDTTRNIASIVVTALLKDDEFPAFRPKHDTELQWDTISSTEVAKHIAVAAKHWSTTLLAYKQGSVIAIWQEILGRHQYPALISAGYVPQLFSVVFANHDVVWDLITKSGASALVFDETFTDAVKTSKIPTAPALTRVVLDATASAALIVTSVSYGDTAMIVHSSGTTSGMPKLIPCTHGWMKSFVVDKFGHLLRNARTPGADVMNTLGSLAHVASFTSFLALLYHRGCMVQTSSMGMSTEELLTITMHCGVNQVVLYAPFLASHIRNAKDSPEVLEILRNCRQIIYTGVALNPEEEQWAFLNSLPITVRNFFLLNNSTSHSFLATVMRSQCGSSPTDRYLRMIPNTSAEMIPSTDVGDADGGLGRHFFELIVHPGNVDSPHPSLLSPDGLHHTGDLFEEVEPGLYLFRGRSGDWIKTLGGFCDAKSIEDNVRHCCADIVHEVVLVGANRPLPCLFLEIRAGVPFDTAAAKEALAQTVIQRTAPFNDRLFPYERVDESVRIHMLSVNSLPRTKEKGNIRRNATEVTYSGILDSIFT